MAASSVSAIALGGGATVADGLGDADGVVGEAVGLALVVVGAGVGASSPVHPDVASAAAAITITQVEFFIEHPPWTIVLPPDHSQPDPVRPLVVHRQGHGYRRLGVKRREELAEALRSASEMP